MPFSCEALVIDLDGTLLCRDSTVSEANVKAINRARDAGLEVIIASGRSLNESREALDAINHDGLVVAAGGSLLCDASSGETLDRFALPSNLIVNLSHAMVADGHRALILKDSFAVGYDYLAVGTAALDPASDWWFDRLGIRVIHAESVNQDTHPDDSVRAGAVGCEEKMSALAAQLRRDFGDRCALQHWGAVTATHALGSSTHLLEIFMPGVNKWTMVERLCAKRGIDPQRVAAIGDGLNDIEMVANAGLGIAMANASPDVLDAADIVTNDCDDSGVAHAIDRILLGQC